MANIGERRDRTCPRCERSFSSVQAWGICPDCGTRFSVDLQGTVLSMDEPPPVDPRPRGLEIPENIAQLVARLPSSVVRRVQAEYAVEDQPVVLKRLAAYEPNVSGDESVWNAVLDQAASSPVAVEQLVVIAKADPRNLFYSSKEDPALLLDKLLKNLRFTGVLSDAEIAELRRGKMLFAHTDQLFEAVCTRLRQCRRITADQYAKILRIGKLLHYPPHVLDSLEP
jgi:hypothetical protein